MGGDAKFSHAPGDPQRSKRALIRVAVAFLAAALSIASSGCRSWVESGLYGVTRIKSPVTYDLRHHELNKPLTGESQARLNELRSDRQSGPAPPAGVAPCRSDQSTTNILGGVERFDGMCDLTNKQTLVMVCFSGGGSRAARMAMHSMAELERRYNTNYARLGPDIAPLMQRIDVYSSVSGGSIYSSLIAAGFHSTAPKKPPPDLRTGFNFLARDKRAQWITSNLASAAALFYVSPAHFGVVPLLLATTEWDTLNLFSRTHAYIQNNRFFFTPPRKLLTMGDLKPTPRFLFNATCVETRLPFIFTQSALHVDSEENPLTGVTYNPARDWLLGARTINKAAVRENALVHATTLEDIGSSPTSFPLSYAVMASAAFPFVFNPLHLKKHNVNGAEEDDGYVRLVDGGIYDNTGVITALELFSHLETHHPNPDRRLVLIAINADNEFSEYKQDSLAKIGHFNVDIPLRGAFEAVSSMHSVYYHQTQLFRAAILARVRELNQRRAKSLIDYFEINLADVRDPELRPKMEKIKTALTIPTKHDGWLQEAVKDILSAKRDDTETELGDAIVQAIGVSPH